MIPVLDAAHLTDAAVAAARAADLASYLPARRALIAAIKAEMAAEAAFYGEPA